MIGSKRFESGERASSRGLRGSPRAILAPNRALQVDTGCQPESPVSDRKQTMATHSGRHTFRGCLHRILDARFGHLRVAVPPWQHALTTSKVSPRIDNAGFVRGETAEAGGSETRPYGRGRYARLPFAPLRVKRRPLRKRTERGAASSAPTKLGVPLRARATNHGSLITSHENV